MCFDIIPASAAFLEQFWRDAAILNAHHRSVRSPVYSFFLCARISAQCLICCSNTTLNSFCVISPPLSLIVLDGMFFVLLESASEESHLRFYLQFPALFVFPLKTEWRFFETGSCPVIFF